MDYTKVFEECKELASHVFWGNVHDKDKHNGCLTFGYEDSLNFLGEDILKFEICVDKIWKHKDKSVYYLRRDDIEQFIIQVIRAIHQNGELNTKNNNQLKDKWNELLNKKMNIYYVAFPIYGAIIPKVTNIGIFVAYNYSDYKEFLIKNNGMTEESIDALHAVKNELDYLVITTEAKDSRRAIELAKTNFELFEYATKFLMQDNANFDIGIFKYKKLNSEEGHAFEKTDFPNGGFASSLKSKGAFQKINIQYLASPQLDSFWKIISHYINGSATEMENRLINAIRWVGMANSDDSEITKYVQYVFALESLLSHDPANEIIKPSISFQLAEYAAFIIGENANEKIISKKQLRQKIFKDVKKIYSNRSKIVHGNDTTINKTALSDAHELIYTLIYSIMQNKELLEFTSIKELDKWIENLRFSP